MDIIRRGYKTGRPRIRLDVKKEGTSGVCGIKPDGTAWRISLDTFIKLWGNGKIQKISFQK